jgi:hypothetical protein
MNLPDNHAERLERARLSLDGLAIGDAFGEMLCYQCASARERVERGLMAGPWLIAQWSAASSRSTPGAIRSPSTGKTHASASILKTLINHAARKNFRRFSATKEANT